ncbi:hypothetical protein L0F63_004285, partial [Massospora cicadina]
MLLMDADFKLKQTQKRKRIPYDKVVKLQQMFDKTDTPSYEVRDQLAEELEMTNREVQVWFQNRRAKLNRMQNDLRPLRAYPRLRRYIPTPITVPTGYVHHGPYTAPVFTTSLAGPAPLPNYQFPTFSPNQPCFNRRSSTSDLSLPSLRELGLDAHLPKTSKLTPPFLTHFSAHHPAPHQPQRKSSFDFSLRNNLHL